MQQATQSPAELFAILTSVQSAMDEIKALNCGGCAVFAGLVGLHLKKAGVKVSAKVADRGEKDAIIEALSNGAKKPCDFHRYGCTFGHVFLEIELNGEKYHFDSNELKKPDGSPPSLKNYPILNGNIPVDHCLYLARCKNNREWNPAFSRKQIPHIIKKIKQIFKAAPAIA